MIEIFDTRGSEPDVAIRHLERPAARQTEDLSVEVARIIERIRAEGDRAVLDLTRRLDRVSLRTPLVESGEIDRAIESLDPSLRRAIDTAIETLTSWHERTLPAEFEVETAPGVLCGRINRAIARVGLYVPAGTAPLPSSVLMMAVPARIAGCEEVVLCSPPGSDGRVDPVILAAAGLCGIRTVFAIGGAQAIAAMAFGTESVPVVDKIFGPGNAWVTEAKQQVAADAAGASIDMPAGPSEVLVIGDEKSRADWIAADLLSQAEHGETSQVVFLTPSMETAEQVREEIRTQLETLPRAEIARVALSSSAILVVDDLDRAYRISNKYAPEHLILNLENPSLERVTSAGSVFLGPYSPEAMGDYCSGTNHVLPTYGWARSCSGVSVASFVKTISWQSLTPAGLESLGDAAEALATAEKLEAHRRAISVRRAG